LKIHAVIGNDGYLPSHLTDRAIEKRVAETVKASLELENAELLMGAQTNDIGHLAGRNGRKYPWSPWGEKWGRTARGVEWLVKAKAGASFKVVISSQKGGKHVKVVNSDV
jgi:hypothetical protein